jgi:hypothetical protein
MYVLGGRDVWMVERGLEGMQVVENVVPFGEFTYFRD